MRAPLHLPPAADRIACVRAMQHARIPRIPVAGKYRERGRTSGTNGGGALAREEKIERDTDTERRERVVETTGAERHNRGE